MPGHLTREGHEAVEEAESGACRLRAALGDGLASGVRISGGPGASSRREDGSSVPITESRSGKRWARGDKNTAKEGGQENPGVAQADGRKLFPVGKVHFRLNVPVTCFSTHCLAPYFQLSMKSDCDAFLNTFFCDEHTSWTSFCH